MSGKGKVVLLLLSLLCLSLVLPEAPVTATVGDGEQAAPKADEAAPGAPAPAAPEAPVSAKGKPARAFGFLGRERRTRPAGEGWGFSALKVGGTTVLVLALAGAAIYFLSKLQKGRPRGGPRRTLELVETLRIGPKKRLHLAQLGHRTVVLAETDKEINLLLGLDEDEVPETDAPAVDETAAPAEIPAPAPRREISFGRLLRRRVAGEGR